MSRASKPDAQLKREYQESLARLHRALAYMSPAARLGLEYFADVAEEAYHPTRQASELGVAVSSSESKSRPPASNTAAFAEFRRLDAQFARIGERGYGDKTGGGGEFERIVYRRDGRWKPARASNGTRMSA